MSGERKKFLAYVRRVGSKMSKAKKGKDANPTITEKMSLAEQVVSGLTEFRDSIRAGERIEKRFTMRTVDLELEPQPYTADEVRDTRDSLKASQAVFAKLLAVSVKTVQAWEQGGSPPKPMACRLLDMMNQDPGRWLQLLRDSAREKVGA